MKRLDYEKLNERISELDFRTKLVKYIFDLQGFELRRLNFKQAADELGADRHTVSRACRQLADMKIIRFSGDGLQISEDLSVSA